MSSVIKRVFKYIACRCSFPPPIPPSEKKNQHISRALICFILFGNPIMQNSAGFHDNGFGVERGSIRHSAE